MTTFLALAVAVLVGLAVYRAFPKRDDLPFWPFQYLPHDRAFSTYDEQRALRDLDAVRAHEPEPEESVQLPETGSFHKPLAA
ncbi:hypothetical protein [Nocardia sp. AG03]|uniref:hypothetical protein n=1 Tax=Nocardia sp. AG03 TaxID=3025312 RepID=UPI00241843A8|nr:hypothetical protein [Nocardia sp. AG03]